MDSQAIAASYVQRLGDAAGGRVEYGRHRDSDSRPTYYYVLR
jgi:hypothetical protein